MFLRVGVGWSRPLVEEYGDTLVGALLLQNHKISWYRVVRFNKGAFRRTPVDTDVFPYYRFRRANLDEEALIARATRVGFWLRTVASDGGSVWRAPAQCGAGVPGSSIERGQDARFG